METMIRVDGLQKAYGRHAAVRGISFGVEKGQMLALLGPNGAGKSTTLDILCTYRKADSGVVALDGIPLGQQNNAIRKKIGAVFQDGMLDSSLTIEENLYTRGRFYGLRGKQLEKLVQQTACMTGVGSLLQRRYGQLSGGQRRRCDIARALIHTPKILFLDEPTTGLDPQMRNAVWETITAIQKQTDMTIVLTTHYMEEAARADRIIIMKEGQIAASGSPATLRDAFSTDKLYIFTQTPAPLQQILRSRGIFSTQRGEKTEITLSHTRNALPILELCRGVYTSFEVIKGSMDDAYLSITGKEPVHA